MEVTNTCLLIFVFFETYMHAHNEIWWFFTPSCPLPTSFPLDVSWCMTFPTSCHSLFDLLNNTFSSFTAARTRAWLWCCPLKHEQPVYSWPYPKEEGFIFSQLLSPIYSSLLRGWSSGAPCLSILELWLACFCWGLWQRTITSESSHVQSPSHIQKTLLDSTPPCLPALTSIFASLFQCTFHLGWGRVLIMMSKFYMYSKCCIYCREVHKLHKTQAGTTVFFFKFFLSYHPN